MANDYFKAQGWFKNYATSSEDSRGLFQQLVKEDEEDFKMSSPMDQEPRNMYSGGGLARALMLLKNFNKTGAVKGLEEKLIKQYKSQGMEFLDAIKKAQTEAGGVRYQGKIKIIDDAMKETNVMSDDYVDLLDMKIKIEDPDFAKQYVKFSENLKNKTRSRYDSDWAEANFGEEYGTKLDQVRVKEINESIDPNITERSLVDDIDDMNIANTDEFFGRKKNADGGFQQLVSNTVDGSRPGYSGDTIEPNISKSPAGKFQVSYKSKYLGTFDSIEEAREIRDTAKEKNPPIKNVGAKLSTEGNVVKVREILNSYLAEGKDSFTFKEVLKSADITSPTEEAKFRKVFDGVLNRKDGKEKYKNLKMTSGNLLSKEDRLKVQSNFDLPEGQTEWLFDKYKYGVDGLKHELLTKRIIKNIKTGVGSPLAATFGNAKGWMSHSMYRVYKNQTEPVIGSDGEPTGKRITKKGFKLTYEPLYGQVASGETKITGFKDNTAAGKGGEFYASKKHEKKGAANWDDHLDYEKVNKMVDITKRVGQEPSEMLQKLLTEKGFKEKVRLNDILSYDRYYTRLGEISPRELIKAQIVMHHSGGVGAKGNLNAAATKDIQLLTGANNATAVSYENIVNGTKKRAPRALTTAENNILKNIGAKITGIDGTVYGGGSLDPDKQFSLIEKQAADMVKKDTFTQEGYKKYLKSLENDLVALCPRKGKSSGGRIGFNLGSGAACGAKFLEEKLKDGKGTKVERKLMADIVSKGAAIKNFAKSALNPLELLNPKNYLGPQAIALMGAFEVGDVTYDVINNNKPIKEALGDNWILKYASPYNQEEEQVKAVEAKNISGSPAMQTYMKKVKFQAEFEREDKKLQKLKKDTPSKNNPKVQEQIKEQQAVVDGLVNNWEQFITNSTVDVNGEKVLTLESGKQDFEQAFGQIIEKRGAGEYVPADDKQSLMKTYMEGPSENKYINTGSDLINQGDSLSYKYKKDSGKDQGRNLSETEREALKLFPFEQGSLRADYTKPTYKDFNYTPQKLPVETRQEYENLATKQGILPPRTSLSQTPMRDGSTYDYLKDLTELYNNSQKAKQASRFPGYSGTQEPAKYATGGIIGLRSKYEYKK